MDNHEFHTKHKIIDACACCNAPIQKESQEIKDYLNNLD
jgi:hypothetical protein